MSKSISCAIFQVPPREEHEELETKHTHLAYWHQTFLPLVTSHMVNPPCREKPKLADLLTRRHFPLKTIGKNLVLTEVVHRQVSGPILLLLPQEWQWLKTQILLCHSAAQTSNKCHIIVWRMPKTLSKMWSDKFSNPNSYFHCLHSSQTSTDVSAF